MNSLVSLAAAFFVCANEHLQSEIIGQFVSTYKALSVQATDVNDFVRQIKANRLVMLSNLKSQLVQFPEGRDEIESMAKNFAQLEPGIDMSVLTTLI